MGLPGTARFVSSESGATAVEYGLILSLIAAAIVGAVISVGDSVAVGLSTLSGNWP